MIKLKIDNFGPIKHAELDFKKINILIGQQGAGKSCILKIAAFCMWLEKVYLSGEIDDLQRGISQKEFVEKHLLEFYKLDEYAVVAENKYSTISFNDNDNIKICVYFKQNDDKWIDIELINKPKSSHKIAYIPAERFLVSAIPNLLELRIRDNDIYKYLVDWEYAHRCFPINNKLKILKLKANFYYDEGSRTDYLEIKDNKKTKTIRLANAASGFQSVIPICVLINYYLGNNGTLSLVMQKRVRELHDLIKQFSNDDTLEKDLTERIKYIRDNRNCNIFLEEPEANIFPDTQNDLVRWLITAFNNGFDNSLFIATHSPYILSAFNNLIQASNSSNDSNIAEIQNIMQMKQFVNFEDISVFEVADGTVKDIKNYEMRIIDANAIDSVSDLINEQFSKLLQYEGD